MKNKHLINKKKIKNKKKLITAALDQYQDR